jgi:ATP-dependent helicase HrpB
MLAATDVAGVLLAFAYPDRVARRRAGGEGRYLLSNGRGAHFAEAQPLARSEFLVIAALDDSELEARIFLAAPLSREALEATLGAEIELIERVEWNERERAVRAVAERRLGALVVESTLLSEPDSERVAATLIAGIRSLSLGVLPWSTESRTWQARVEFVRALPSQVAAGWPDVSDQALLATLDRWLGPWLGGMTRIAHLQRLDLQSTFDAMLSHELRRRLGELAPTHISVPSGSRIRVDYVGAEGPSLSVRVQELFGLESTPRIGGGAMPVLIKLLSPAQRPVQVTRDLASFWDHGYAQVRKELRGRYPKHPWPENPRLAPAVRGVRRRQS